MTIESLIALERLENDVKRGNCDYNIEPYVDIIKQDLERLKQLEIADRNNQNLVKTNVDLVNKNLALQKENKELLVNKNFVICLANKFKKIIDILENLLELELETINEWGKETYLLNSNSGAILLKETYDLLKDFIKEVNENET